MIPISNERSLADLKFLTHQFNFSDQQGNATRFIIVFEGMKKGVFWDVTLCGSFKNRRFGGTWRLLHQGDKNR
jgi:hypothetical protein